MHFVIKISNNPCICSPEAAAGRVVVVVEAGTAAAVAVGDREVVEGPRVAVAGDAAAAGRSTSAAAEAAEGSHDRLENDGIS